MKLHLFDFHAYFEGLLGMDNLRNMGMKIDLENSIIYSNKASIPIEYKTTTSPTSPKQIDILAQTETITQLEIDQEIHGDYYVPLTEFENDVYIPEGIYKVNKGILTCTIVNKRPNDIKLTFTHPFPAEELMHFDTQNTSATNLHHFATDKKEFDIKLLRTDHLNSEEKYHLTNLAKEFSSIFHIDGTQLTFTNQIKHRISTTDEIPTHAKMYRYPQEQKNELKRQINSLLDQGIIQPSFSPWASPIWIVPKKLDASGQRKWRMVIDYRSLNEKTIGDRYPIPNIDDLLDKLGKCNYFTTLDLASGFHQIEMDPDSIQKTAFNFGTEGHYEFLRMPFGLKNAPATFQRAMNNVLIGLNNVVVYLDDILIFSTSLQEHLENIRNVFKRLKEFNLKVQLDKSEFLKRETAYLGHIITPDGIKPNPDKIKAIKNYPIPKSTKQIKGFLGLTGYYRKFIKDYARIAKPMTLYLKKDSKIDLNNSDYQKSFETLKTVLINEPILKYPDYEKPFILTTDASNYSLGAVLSQGKIGSDLPIGYASRTLNNAEQHYSTTEKELLAIIWSTKYFRPYLYGRRFTIVTDHKPLQWLFSMKEPNSKLVRWRLKLEEFEYDIVYKKGTLNSNADALSRIELHVNETTDRNEVTPNSSDDRMDLDSTLATVDESDQQNDPLTDATDQTVHSSGEEPLIGIKITESPLNHSNNQIIFSSVEHTPSPIRTKNLFTHLKPKCFRQRQYVQVNNNNVERELIDFVKHHIIPKRHYYCYFEDDSLYIELSRVLQRYFKNSQVSLSKCTKLLEDVESSEKQQEIIRNYHTGLTNHRGINETEKQLGSIYFWPRMKQTIAEYINECETCRVSKYDRTPINPKFNVTPTPNRPFKILHIDTVTVEQKRFLSIVDAFSKYAQAYQIEALQSPIIADKLMLYFSHHGLPELICSDNGTEFKNTIIQDLLKSFKIDVHLTSVNHPQSNSIVERFHSTLREHMRILTNNTAFKNQSPEQKVRYATLAYNHSVHSATQFKPIELINGHLGNRQELVTNTEHPTTSDFVQEQRRILQATYDTIHRNLANNKKKVIDKLNVRQNRTEPPDMTEPYIYVKTDRTRHKEKNRFSKDKVTSLDKKRKTVKLASGPKVHVTRLQRPRKTKRTSPSVTDVPCTSHQGQTQSQTP